MAKTAEGQAKLQKMLAAGMGRQQAMKLLIGAQKKAKAGTGSTPSGNAANLPATPDNAAEAANLPYDTTNPAEAVPLVQPTGNVTVDQANVLANILNSPLYTESIKSAYLTQYLPGLTQANYEINRSRAQEVQNSFLRQQAQAQAIREVAGSFAARGLRTPKMVTEGFAPIQQATALEKNAAEQAINDLIANKEVLYGAGTTSQESFIKNPTLFGSIGAGARRTALSELLALPDIYGLTQVAKASSAPLASSTPRASSVSGASLDSGFGSSSPAASGGFEQPQELPTEQAGTPRMNAAQLQAKIAAANKYINQQKAKNNAATVAGATKKLEDYKNQLFAALGGQ